jgi:hypothetical protein
MLGGSMREARDGSVRIDPRIPPCAFRALLVHIYTDDVDCVLELARGRGGGKPTLAQRFIALGQQRDRSQMPHSEAPGGSLEHGAVPDPVDMLHLASAYDLPALFAASQVPIAQMVSPRNAAAALGVARALGASVLADACLACLAYVMGWRFF